MTKKTYTLDYSAISTIGNLDSPCSNTFAFFDKKHRIPIHSAIDQFIENCNALNIIVLKSTITPEFSRVLLLGYVSAVESYFRTVFRAIVNTDLQSNENSHSALVPFGAALFYKKEMLAEALLESYSFSGEKDIKKAINNLVGIHNIDEDIKNLLLEYEKICQLRHCCVHRFGKLGSQNGIALGLGKHKEVLEKPLKIDKETLEAIVSWLMSFVKAINNYLFKVILDRTTSTKSPYQVHWKWSFSRDRSKFNSYYKIFSTTSDSVPSPPIEDIYKRFKDSKSARKKL